MRLCTCNTYAVHVIQHADEYVQGSPLPVVSQIKHLGHENELSSAIASCLTPLHLYIYSIVCCRPCPFYLHMVKMVLPGATHSTAGSTVMTSCLHPSCRQ